MWGMRGGTSPLFQIFPIQSAYATPPRILPPSYAFSFKAKGLKGATALGRNSFLSEHFILLPVLPPSESSNAAISTIAVTPPKTEVSNCLKYCDSLKVTQTAHVRAGLTFSGQPSSSNVMTLTPLCHCKSIYGSSNPFHSHACFQGHLDTSALCISPSAAAHSLIRPQMRPA